MSKTPDSLFTKFQVKITGGEMKWGKTREMFPTTCFSRYGLGSAKERKLDAQNRKSMTCLIPSTLAPSACQFAFAGACEDNSD